MAQRRSIPVLDHELHATHAHDVGDLVRIRDDRGGAMCDRLLGEAERGQER